DDIHDLSKIEARRLTDERETYSASASAVAALDLIVPPARAMGGELEIDSGAGCLYVGDQDRVRQILLIRSSNALKASEPGGTILVSCDTSRSPDAGATLPGSGPWTCIRVVDTGIGISPGEAETIFQPFVQVDRENTR